MNKKLKSIISFVLVVLTVISVATVASADVVNMLPFPTTPGKPTIRYIEGDNTYKNITFYYEDLRLSVDEIGYYIYRSNTGKKGSWTKIADLKPGTEKSCFVRYEDQTVVPNQSYYYAVRPYAYGWAEMDTAYSGWVSTRIEQPKFDLVGNSGYGILLRWNDRDKSERVSGYKIYRSLTGKKGTWTCIKNVKSGKAGSFTDTKVEIGETYYYCMKAYLTDNGKNYYSQQDSEVYCKTILDARQPQNLQVQPKYDGVHISFNKVNATRGYLIYRSETGLKGTWTKIATIKNNNTARFIDTTAETGKTYFYTVKSFKTIDGQNYYSPDAVKVSAVCSTGIVKIKQKIVSNATGSFYKGEAKLYFYVDGDPKGDELKFEVEDESIATAEFIGFDEYGSAEFLLTRVGPGETTFRVYYENHPYSECAVKISVS